MTDAKGASSSGESPKARAEKIVFAFEGKTFSSNDSAKAWLRDQIADAEKKAYERGLEDGIEHALRKQGETERIRGLKW